MTRAAQVEKLRVGGSAVELIIPESDAEHLFGANAMDPLLRPPVARAGAAAGTLPMYAGDTWVTNGRLPMGLDPTAF